MGHPVEVVEKLLDRYQVGVVERKKLSQDESLLSVPSGTDLLPHQNKKIDWWQSFREWTIDNRYCWYIFTSIMFLFVCWISAGFGTQPGYGGRFDIVGFQNQTDYAYKLAYFL